MLRRAIREGWDVPEFVRPLAIQDVLAVLVGSGDAPRLSNATVRTVIAMESANQESELDNRPRQWETGDPCWQPRRGQLTPIGAS